MARKWETKEQLTDLLCSLVNYPSVTGTKDEIAMVEYIHHLLEGQDYFRQNSDHLQLHPLKDGRQLLTALVKNNDAKETIILLSHIDVVGIEDYGSLQNLAFHPKELTQELQKRIEELPKEAANDLKTGDWLFGRGTMDMKSGTTVHLSLLEKAMEGEFDGNILLLAVPDEEANSLGMITALPVLNELKQQHELEFKATMNGEPMFSKYPGDRTYYLYSGSIGKVLPGFLCYGKETHVGEPFAGLNANLMVSYLTQELELSEDFIETVGDETTPPPISLMQKDLKDAYSVQTPQAAVAMYNVLYMKQTLSSINEKLLAAAHRASQKAIAHYKQKSSYYMAETEHRPLNMDITVLTFEELYREAEKRFGKREVERRQNLLISHRDKGDRDFSTLLVHDLASLCKDIGPMIILFYSPPFYPSVSSNQDPYIEAAVQACQNYAREKYSLQIENTEYFTGLSDLSFIGPTADDSPLGDLLKQMPIQGRGFELSSDLMQATNMPVINIGPLGKDPHQWTERLELTYSFEYLPDMLHHTLQSMFRK
ncbi:M20/M25/M40 family metallo-hydrolase [Thalassobacillus pellis]|uniref:M20/M25/M40 family metallo-hydrolase n=1 Tax=Thalassobacillus pellis TaxID=748008 RepID=UPI001960AEAC|nr:M20/M25/M40 family metallo-hydrolase [Thalassobacillus pellis]MBM7552379.1 arginine utilization protein RocB [Thalassobacillus pellis]